MWRFFELKSKRDYLGSKIVDGAYSKMIEKITNNELPNFFFLTYDLKDSLVTNFIIIPKYFFSFSMIEKRNALTKNAVRSGWIGCNILLEEVPSTGKIYYFKDKSIINKNIVKDLWEKTIFIKQSNDINLRGWTLDIINCIDKTGKSEFSLNDIYSF